MTITNDIQRQLVNYIVEHSGHDYLNTNFAQVIYLARDTGAVQVYSLRRDTRRGEEIARKLDRLVDAVTTMKRPECTCGRCKE